MVSIPLTRDYGTEKRPLVSFSAGENDTQPAPRCNVAEHLLMEEGFGGWNLEDR